MTAEDGTVVPTVLGYFATEEQAKEAVTRIQAGKLNVVRFGSNQSELTPESGTVQG